MSDALEETPLDQALRDGLRALPVPETAPDFDARVLAALRVPAPWWRRWWEPARPLLLGASCSLAVTLLALHWTLSAPVLSAPPLLGVGGSSRSARAPSLDALLDQPNLSAGSLSAWEGPPAPNNGGAEKNDPSNRRPVPKQRAQLLRRPVLMV